MTKGIRTMRRMMMKRIRKKRWRKKMGKHARRRTVAKKGREEWKRLYGGGVGGE